MARRTSYKAPSALRAAVRREFALKAPFAITWATGPFTISLHARCIELSTKKTSETGVSTRLNSSEPGWFSSTSFSPIPTRTTSRRRRIRSDSFVKRWAYPLSTFPLSSTKAVPRAVRPALFRGWISPLSRTPLPSLPPVVTFSYLDSGVSARSGYGRHLAAYQPLFRQLNSFRFLYISPKTSHFQSAEQRFRAGVERRLESDVTAELLWYFEIRRKWEDREYIVPVDLEFLSEASAVFMASAAMVPIPRGTPVTSPKKLSARSSARCTSTHCKFRDRLRRRPPILSRMERKPGERSMKDAVHPHVHRSVHPGGERKCWGALGLCGSLGIQRSSSASRSSDRCMKAARAILP